MDARERGKTIVNYLKQHGYADVAFLSEMLHVSEMTVRRDLDALERRNFLLRVHGGAKLASQRMYERPRDERLREQNTEKHSLGQYAASLVEEGDAIAIDSSSTTYAMLPHLEVAVTVITNNITVATALEHNPKAQVILLGGALCKPIMSLQGPDVAAMCRKYFVDKAFLSSKAVDFEHGASDSSAEEAETKRALIASAKQTFFLFDHTKLGTTAFCSVCPIDEIDHLIVDESRLFTRQQRQFLANCAENGTMVHNISGFGAPEEESS